MKRIDPVIVALIFIIIAYLCIISLVANIEIDKVDRYKNIRTKLIIKSRAEPFPLVKNTKIDIQKIFI